MSSLTSLFCPRLKVRNKTLYRNELKTWEFGKTSVADLKQRSGAETAQLE